MLPLLERAEPRFAESSREMMQRGDYIVPFFNNTYRFDKPPLANWGQVLSFRVFGQNDLAARFPSAIAASLTSLLLLIWGTRCASTRVGWWAAIIFALSLQVVIYAKAAVADMWLVLFVTSAHFAAYELLKDSLGQSAPPDEKEARVFRWLFYFSLAFAFLAKGPIGWAPLITLAVTKFFLPAAPFTKRFQFGRGIVFVLLVVACWAVPASIRTHGEYARIALGQHIVERSVTAMKGQGASSFGGYLVTLPFYFVTIFFSFFPWSVKLPSMVGRLWRQRAPWESFLLVGAAVFFVIFTFFKTKLPHYTMPALPLLALLLARQLAQIPKSKAFVRRSALIFGCCYLLVALAGPPFTKRLFPTVCLLDQVRADLRPEMEFGAIDYLEPSLVWYFRHYVNGWMTNLDAGNARAFMEQTGPRFAIVPTEMLASVFPNPPNEWKKYTAEAFYPVKGKKISLTLLLKPE